MRFIIIIMCISLCDLSAAQVRMFNCSLTDSSLKILYIGIDNAIELKCDMPSCSNQLMARGAGSTITRIDDTRYNVRVTKADTCRLIVLKNGKEIFSKTYRTEIVPDPVATLNGKYNTTVSIANILVEPFLKVIIPGSHLRHDFRVWSFTMISTTAEDSVFIPASRDQLIWLQLKNLKSLSPGDTVHFTNIRFSCPTGRTRAAPPFWIKVE